MSHVIQCPCGQQMTVEDSQVGIEVLCVNCRQKLEVPPPSSDPSLPAPARPVNTPKDPASLFLPPDPGVFTPDKNISAGQPHRGGLVLGFGILGLTSCCCGVSIVFSILAVVVGFLDLGEMEKGTKDSSGESLTIAGIVLGGVGFVLTILAYFLGGLPFWGYFGLW